MKLETFFEKFDLFADAPDAVAILRDVVYSVGLAAEKWPQETLESVALKVTDGTHQTPRYVEVGIPFVSVKDFSGGSLDMSSTRFITLEEHSEIYKRSDPKRGDILLGRIGTIGKAVVVDTDIEFSLFVSAAQIRPDRGKILSCYLQYVLNSPFCRAQFDNIKVGGATHTNKLNLKDLRSVKVPLPPLAEQKRIVAKVDELMALCDRLEAQQQERETRHAALARASLARFADAPTPANLQFLFHPSYAISPADLRKSILTLAVQGKLVPQDSNDGDVEDSVRAARKKAGLPVRALTELASDETPFEAPDSWRWVTVADVADTRLGKMLDKEKNRGEAHPYLRNTNVHWFRFELESIKTMLFESAELDEYRVESGDVLICEGGHGIARSAVWDGQIPGIMFQKALHRVRPLSCLDGHFLTFCLWVYERDGILQRYYTGAGIPHFTGKALARVTFPLPPLAEQRRIVAKVEQLMALVDALETQLAASRATAANLLEAVVGELTTHS